MISLEPTTIMIQDDSEISINADSMNVDAAVRTSGDSNDVSPSDTTNVLGSSEKAPLLDQDYQDSHDTTTDTDTDTDTETESPGLKKKQKREDHDQDQCNYQTVSLPMCPTIIKAVSVMVPLSASVLPAAAAAAASSAPISNEDLDSILMPPPPPSRPSSPSSTSLKFNQRRGRRRSNAVDLTHEFLRRDRMDHNTTTSTTNSTPRTGASASTSAINVGDAGTCTRDPIKTETQANPNASPCSVYSTRSTSTHHAPRRIGHSNPTLFQISPDDHLSNGHRMAMDMPETSQMQPRAADANPNDLEMLQNINEHGAMDMNLNLDDARTRTCCANERDTNLRVPLILNSAMDDSLHVQMNETDLEHRRLQDGHAPAHAHAHAHAHGHNDSCSDCNGHGNASNKISTGMEMLDEPTNHHTIADHEHEANEVHVADANVNTNSGMETDTCTNVCTDSDTSTGTCTQAQHGESTKIDSMDSQATNNTEIECKYRYDKPTITSRFSDIIGHGAAKLRLDEMLLPLALPVSLARNILTGKDVRLGGGFFETF